MTFETLNKKLSDAKHSVSLAAHQLEIAESMATIRPCPLVEKSIAAYERALDVANEIRAEMAMFYDASLVEMDIRCGRA